MSGAVTRYGVVQHIPVDCIDDSPFQVRISYGDIDGLAADIKARGLLQPILVRPRGDRYEVVHGHRRLRAVRLNGARYILAVVRDLSDEDALLILGSENIHRRQLSPIEEARYYQTLKDRGMSVKRIAESISKSRDHIRLHLNLLDLPNDIQARIHAGEIPYSKARQLTILTREPATTVVVAGVKDFQPAPRTTRHFDAIRVIADEAAKGGSLKTERAVAEAARLVREGVPVQDAIERAKEKAGAEGSRERIEKRADPPEVILHRILERQPDSSTIKESERKVARRIVADLLRKGILVCPSCGGGDLVWSCTGRRLDDEEGD